MGQIAGKYDFISRVNLKDLSTVPTPAAGEHILVSSDNSMNAAGQGNFDCYIVGDGTTIATALPLIKTNDVSISNQTSLYDTDFSLIDENGYSIVDFINGHIQTKEFDSSKSAQEQEEQGSADFAISDGNGNCIAVFENGHIRMKNFKSEEFVQKVKNISDTNDIIGKYKGKIISILGDSISTFGTPSATNETGDFCYSYYPTATCRYSIDGVDSIAFSVEDTYWMKLITKLGATLGVNESWRGTCVTGTDANTFNNQTRINHLGENGTPDVILVFGGTNDAGLLKTIGTFDGGVYNDYNTDEEIAALDVSTFANAYKAMLIRLMKSYPTAEIVCLLPTFTTSYYTIKKLDDYVEVIKEICDYFGVKWIDTRVSGINIFNKSTYLVDGIHPNKKGMELLAEKIYKHLIFD